MNLEEAFDRYSEGVIALTKKLVSFPSINRPPLGKEGPCQKYIASWMQKVFDQVDIFEPDKVPGVLKHPSYWPGRDYNGRPNVVGVLKGQGKGRSLILNGHIDVVPDDPKPWMHKAFGGEIIGGKLYGRGSLDMKGGLAAAMMATKIIRKAGIKLSGDVILESVVDEEYAGANGTLACVVRGYKADAAISMEPTWMEIGTSMRSGRLYEFLTKGIAGMPVGGKDNVNPAYSISRIALGIEQFDYERNRNPVDDPVFKEIKRPQPAFVIKMKAGQVEPGGLIGIPDQAWLHTWIYGMPRTTESGLRQEVYDFFNRWINNDPILKANPPQINEHTRFLEGSVIPIDHPIVATVIESITKTTGETKKVKAVEVTGDNGILVNYGNTPTICLGPGGGDLHAADEYVNIDDLLALTKIYTHIIAEWCA